MPDPTYPALRNHLDPVAEGLHSSDQITNESNATGGSVTAALNHLHNTKTTADDDLILGEVLIGAGTSHLQASGVQLSELVTDSEMSTALSGKQPADAGLTSLAALTGTGYVKATAADTFTQVGSIPSSDITGLGTAAALNVPSSGNAASGEVVKGSDSRLSDARTPTSHSHVAADITDFASASRAQTEAELIAGSNITITSGGTGSTRTLTIASTGGGASNLALGAATATTQPVTNSNGTGFTLPSATTSAAGLLSAADKVKANLYQAQNSDLASASTVDLSTTTGETINITGSATIDSFGTAPAGTSRRLIFTSSGIVLASGTNLLPSGASIITSIGDSCTATSLGGGVWLVHSYSRQTGKAVIPPDASEITSGTFDNARIASNSLTNAKLVNVATSTLKGRATAGTGAPEDLSADQARLILGTAFQSVTAASDVATLTLTLSSIFATCNHIELTISHMKATADGRPTITATDQSDVAVTFRGGSTSSTIMACETPLNMTDYEYFRTVYINNSDGDITNRYCTSFASPAQQDTDAANGNGKMGVGATGAGLMTTCGGSTAATPIKRMKTFTLSNSSGSIKAGAKLSVRGYVI